MENAIDPLINWNQYCKLQGSAKGFYHVAFLLNSVYSNLFVDSVVNLV